jgi:hypothetical protein
MGVLPLKGDTYMIFMNRTFKLKRFELKYGDGFLSCFDKAARHEMSLADISRKYSFSLERARQLFLIIKKYPYTKVKKEFILRKKINKSLICHYRKNPSYKINNYLDGQTKIGALAEYKVYNICLDLGFNVEIPMITDYDLIINGYNVDVKSCSKPLKMSDYFQKYYSFHIGHNLKQNNFDFIICYLKDVDLYYIFPKASLKKKGAVIYINRNKTHHKHWQDKYVEAWHLLMK